MAPVPGFMPGMRPMKLFTRMKKNTVTKNGKCFFQLVPTTPLATSFSTYSIMYSTPLTNVPCGTSVWRFMNAKIKMQNTAAATRSQNGVLR